MYRAAIAPQILSSTIGRLFSPGASSVVIVRWMIAQAVPVGKKYLTIIGRTMAAVSAPNTPMAANSGTSSSVGGLKSGWATRTQA